MYVDEFTDAGPYDSNLGFSLNPIKNIQQVTAKVQAVVQKIAPPIIAKLSPTNIIAQQAAGVAKIDTQAKALALRAAQMKAKTIYTATAASPLGKKMVTPMLDAGAVKSPIGRQLMPEISANIATQQAVNAQNQATYDAQVAAHAKAQAAADAQYASEQAAYDAQVARDQAAQQATWQANQAQIQPGYSGGWSPDTSQLDPLTTSNDPTAYDYSALDTASSSQLPTITDTIAPIETAPVAVSHWYDWWLTPVKPLGKTTATNAAPAATDTAQVAPWDPYSLSTDNTGDNMQLSNIPSKNNLFPGTFTGSGMGGIWGDLMTTGLTAYSEKTKASIAQSQAAQADATARIAASNAAAVAAQQRPALSTPLMLAGAAGLVGVLIYMRKKKRA